VKKGKVKFIQKEVLSHHWYLYQRISFELEVAPGVWVSQRREVLDRGNGAAILLYNKKAKTVILTKQFRLPSYLNGNSTGELIEVCAGSIEDESPEENIIRETEEETGYKISNPKKVFEAYMSPGAVTEVIHFFLAEYEADHKVGLGGGNPDETEHIEVLEMSFSQASQLMNQGEIKDAKTIMLLQYAQIHKLIE
jgi:nudix-type nucleoside diphosphatase (YffH/AdpP family)